MGKQVPDKMSVDGTSNSTKIRAAMGSSGAGGFRKYMDLCHGDVSMATVVRRELLVALFGSIPGALGLLLRRTFYPSMFGYCGTNVIFGRNITFRHAHKIVMGNNVIIDDNCVIDAKGHRNSGIVIGDNVFIGRNSIVYCKNGDILLENGVNISSSCTVFSSNKLTIRKDTMVGAYSYLLSGGEYEFAPGSPNFVEQDGAKTKGELAIGPNTWLGARVTVLDGGNIGEHCVIGACSLVNRPVPSNSLAYGIPAKVAKNIAQV